MSRFRPVAAALLAAATLSAATSAKEDDQAAEIQALRSEIDALRATLPSQSHAMTDVDYQFSNLWFAAKAKNWPLAQFYLNETMSHIGWMIRLRPVRQTSHGDLALQPIFDAMQSGPVAEAKAAIGAKDNAAFESAYTHVMTACYSCHVAAEKPYLRPHIPDAPATRIIDMTPTPTGAE
jgi:hypothetical protein